MKPTTFWKRIKTLEKLEMIELKSNNKYTVVSVTNWASYQISSEKVSTEGQQSDNRVTTEGQQSDTDKKVKKVKKDKKVNKEPKNKHGEYGHVLLTEEQYLRLIADYPEPVVKETIIRMDEWCQMKGTSYKDYNLALRKWIKDPLNGSSKKPQAGKKSEFTDYEQRPSDFNSIEKMLLGGNNDNS